MTTKWPANQINTAFREKKLIDYLDLYGKVLLLSYWCTGNSQKHRRWDASDHV